MGRALMLATALAALLVSPAFARQRCDMQDTRPGLHIEFGFSFGGERDAQTQEIIDQMELRKRGVNARMARPTPDGCIEAWVQRADGHWDTEYYDPDTYELVAD